MSIYEELLAADPANEEYAQSVASLYAKIGDDSRRDAGRRAELEALLSRARRTADAVERAQRIAERTDEY